MNRAITLISRISLPFSVFENAFSLDDSVQDFKAGSRPGVKPVASRILGSDNRTANKSQRSAVERPNEVLSIKENRCCRRFAEKTILTVAGPN